MTLEADKRTLARIEDGTLRRDSDEARALTRRSAANVDLQVDLVTARLAEIPDPAPGFDTRKRRDQEHYDLLLAELETWRALQRDYTELLLRELEDDLTLSAERADLAAAAFDRQLENLHEPRQLHQATARLAEPSP